MGVNDTEKRILALAEECIRLGKQERPEKQWIGRMYERFRAANGMPGKAETDGLIFRKMYGNAPEKSIGYFENPLLENRQASAGEPGAM